MYVSGHVTLIFLSITIPYEKDDQATMKVFALSYNCHKINSLT